MSEISIAPQPAPKPPSRRTLWMIVGISTAGVVLGIWLVMTLLPRWLSGSGGASRAANAAGVDRKIRATLFYVADDGAELVPVSREVPLGATPAEQARRIMEAELQAAPAGLF